MRDGFSFDYGATNLTGFCKADIRAVAAKDSFVRDPAKIPRNLMGHVDIVEGSHGDRSVIAQVENVFWLPPGAPASASAQAAYIDLSRLFCEALAGSQVRHVVGISALGRGSRNPRAMSPQACTWTT